jgi:hypothetical protein
MPRSENGIMYTKVHGIKTPEKRSLYKRSTDKSSKLYTANNADGKRKYNSYNGKVIKIEKKQSGGLDDVKHANGLSHGFLTWANQRPTRVSQITFDTLEKLTYVDAHKKILEYTYNMEDGDQDCSMSWSVVTKTTDVTTVLDGKETTNTANPGDVIMCGPQGEKYVVRLEKMGQLYERSTDPTIMKVKNELRKVAEYTGNDGEFKASWGDMMKLKRGDYVVREDKDKYYRIERSVFDKTYEILS